MATLGKAVERLPTDRAATIMLLGGVYQEKVTIANVANQEYPLVMEAAPGQTVLFEGGREISEWKPYRDEPGLYVIDAPHREPARDYESPYLDVWEAGNRVRYRKQLDVQGALVRPASVCPLGGDRILVHTSNGGDPKSVGIWHNQISNGFSIERSNVTLRGLIFQNYVGGASARAITVGLVNGVTIEKCEFSNCTIGIYNLGSRTRVENCRIREVGLGVVTIGRTAPVDTVIRFCVIESAVGLFAFEDLGEHRRDGIRLYHCANGATIEGNVTVGFWAGLYIKTISARQGSRPFYVRDNIFLDGIRSGANHRQPRSDYARNIIGPSVEMTGVGPNGSYLKKMEASVKENYFFGPLHENSGENLSDGNRAGPEPFVQLVKGDLRLRQDLPLPEGVREGRAFPKEVKWSPRLAALLGAREGESKAVAFVRKPSATSSERGSLVVAGFTSLPSRTTLRYRERADGSWKEIAGITNTVLPGQSLAAAAPFEARPPTEYSVIFPLIHGELQPHTDYEYQVVAVDDGSRPIESLPDFFRTTGKSKRLYVEAGACADGADGSENHPFPQLQPALDRALPGDTVTVRKGIYTRPILLVHGGTAQAPLKIEGAGMKESILDGGRETGDMVAILNTGNIEMSGFQIRWFGNNGIRAKQSSDVAIRACWILNSFLSPGGAISGRGIFLENCKDWKVTHSLFNKLENGIYALNSPYLTIENNTSVGNIYSGVTLINSGEGSRIMRNSFNFTGNASIRFTEKEPAAFASLQCDYNNYGSYLRKDQEIDESGVIIQTGGVRPENDFLPAKRYGRVHENKFIVGLRMEGKLNAYFRMADWREFSGKDAHSIFADPEFVDPLRGDFRLLSRSPNILGEGMVIGMGSIQKNQP
ncbi:MAG TPA: right-handed parallel beta-helix repeat-containing protein [Chthoniobacteraceae bacterium]|nr:right-handed parallel beta-helix repeat-containing protein [Chthoniobacteraceae bacterium]